MDYYVVTAVSEEEEKNVSCNATGSGALQNCKISLKGVANDYNFTAYSVTGVNDSFSYNGSIATDCCKFQ